MFFELLLLYDELLTFEKEVFEWIMDLSPSDPAVLSTVTTVTG